MSRQELTRRTDVWEVTIERYELIGYIVNVHEQGAGVAGMEWCLTRRAARRWASRHIRNQRRRRARQAEKYVLGAHIIPAERLDS